MHDVLGRLDTARLKLRDWDWHSYVIYIAFVVVFAFFALTLGNQGFLTPTYLINIVRQTASISVIAVGMTFVISTAEIDLSVGAVAGLASVTSAIAIANWGLFPGIAVGLLTGALVGGLNGLLVTRVAIPSFLVTLGMMGVAHGSAQWLTSSAPQPILNATFNNYFGGGDIGPISTLFAWPLILVAIGAVVLNKTSFGRQVLATGGNRVAAEFSGIDTKKIKFTVMMACGVTAALGGMLYAGRLQTGRFQWGEGDELSAIAAVILGGTNLFGGKGAVIGTLVGALLIGLINSGLILAGLESSQQEMVRGAIIIAAVALGRRR
jgi:ribose transport system permease protein